MVYDGTNVLLFGGQDTGTFGLIFQAAHYFGDAWQWDGKHWTQLQDIGPAARWPAGMTFDSVRNATFYSEASIKQEILAIPGSYTVRMLRSAAVS